jgi:hypothetical protein
MLSELFDFLLLLADAAAVLLGVLHDGTVGLAAGDMQECHGTCERWAGPRLCPKCNVFPNVSLQVCVQIDCACGCRSSCIAYWAGKLLLVLGSSLACQSLQKHQSSFKKNKCS